jgi:hypothetical protein
MRLTRQNLLLLAVAAVAAVWLLPPAARWLWIDMCLDQGGRWNYDVGACEFAESAASPEPVRGVSSDTVLAKPVCVD